jgi:hypothetical protein
MLSQAKVRVIQKALKALSIYTGPIDGLEGPMTRAAIRGFQRINGLKDDGIVGPITWAKMFPDDIIPDREEYVPSDAVSNIWPKQSQEEMVNFFGEMGKNQTSLELPFKMKIAWNLNQYIDSFKIHEKVHDSAKRVLTRVLDHYGPDQINALRLNVFGGCLNVRLMRGSKTKWSIHSWGCAIDFDPANNQLKWGKDKATLAKPDCEMFWKLWEEEGWLSLGRARNYDWMHVQAAVL